MSEHNFKNTLNALSSNFLVIEIIGFSKVRLNPADAIYAIRQYWFSRYFIILSKSIGHTFEMLDKLPIEWSDTFAVAYSNSFNQSYDPCRSANEWLRVIKNGGLLILGYSVTQPTKTDPVGDLGLGDILQLSPGELLLYDRDRFNYRYALIEVRK